ncbi:MAG: hypothetical protein U0X91_09975 [Spirosomataceae bacterium]
MKELRYTLISDGSSDKVLLNVIQWLLDDLFPQLPFLGTYGDLRILPHPPGASDVRNRIERAQEYYPFDILFYHRDAESVDEKIISQRIQEIHQEITEERKKVIVCVVPIKMMETWLLIDREAIKKAAGNRNYNVPIELPSLQKLEKVQDPKALLHEILKQVSGRKSRNLKSFNVHAAVHLVGEYIEDYSPLRNLKAFKQLETDVKIAVNHFKSNC